jgi:hypothetical protein
MMNRLNACAAVAMALLLSACADITIDSTQSCVESPVTLGLSGEAAAGSADAGAAPVSATPGAASATLTGTTPIDLGVLTKLRSAGALKLTFASGTFTLSPDAASSLQKVALQVAPTDTSSTLPTVSVMSYALSDEAKKSGSIDLGQVMDAATVMKYLEAGNVTLTYAATLTDGSTTKLTATNRMCVQTSERIVKSAF